MMNDAVTLYKCLSKSAALKLIHANSKHACSPAVTLEVPALPWPPDWWTLPCPPRRRWRWRYYSPRFWRACWAHSALRGVRPLTESVCGACLNARKPLCLDVLVFWSGELAVTRRVCESVRSESGRAAGEARAPPLPCSVWRHHCFFYECSLALGHAGAAFIYSSIISCSSHLLALLLP